MDLQTYLDNAMKASRKKTLADSDQLDLGDIIAKIEAIVSKKVPYENEPTVVFDFENLFPTEIDSWRGSYDELALNFESSGDRMKVSDFLKMLKDCIGKIFTGYKGGDYVMSINTPVWVANYGNSGNTAVVNVVDNDYYIMLITGYREF